MPRLPPFSLVQIGAAIALAKWSVQSLAIKSGVTEEAASDLLAGRPVAPDVRRRIEEALYDRAFVRPIPASDKAGEGVRFRLTPEGIRSTIRSRASDGMVELKSRVWLRRHWEAKR